MLFIFIFGVLVLVCSSGFISCCWFCFSELTIARFDVFRFSSMAHYFVPHFVFASVRRTSSLLCPANRQVKGFSLASLLFLVVWLSLFLFHRNHNVFIAFFECICFNSHFSYALRMLALAQSHRFIVPCSACLFNFNALCIHRSLTANGYSSTDSLSLSTVINYFHRIYTVIYVRKSAEKHKFRCWYRRGKTMKKKSETNQDKLGHCWKRTSEWAIESDRQKERTETLQQHRKKLYESNYMWKIKWFIHHNEYYTHTHTRWTENIYSTNMPEMKRVFILNRNEWAEEKTWLSV